MGNGRINSSHFKLLLYGCIRDKLEVNTLFTCSAVKSGSSAREETMMECMSSCSLSSSSSDRSAVTSVFFYSGAERGGRNLIKALNPGTMNIWDLWDKWDRNLETEGGCSVGWMKSGTKGAESLTGFSFRLTVGMWREHVRDFFQSTGITQP